MNRNFARGCGSAAIQIIRTRGYNMFDQAALLQRLRELPFPEKEYWVVAGGAMVLHGFRQQTRDIDLGGSTRLADQLERQGYAVSRCEDGTRKIIYSELY